VKGNEEADKLAKAGATASLGAILDIAPMSLAWIQRQARAASFYDWLEHWESHKKPSSYAGFPRRRIDEVFKSAKRLVTSQLLHLRTNHGPFQAYRHRFAEEHHPSATCPCGQGDETAEHLLLRCPQVARERDRLIQRLLPTPLTMGTALHTARGLELTMDFLKETGVGMRGWRGRRQRNSIGDEEEVRVWRRPGLGWGRLWEGTQVGG